MAQKDAAWSGRANADGDASCEVYQMAPSLTADP
jgi:hypothetical protein